MTGGSGTGSNNGGLLRKASRGNRQWGNWQRGAMGRRAMVKGVTGRFEATGRGGDGQQRQWETLDGGTGKGIL